MDGQHGKLAPVGAELDFGMSEDAVRFRSVFAGAADAMLLVAVDGTITLANDAALRQLDLGDASDVRERSYASMFASDHAWIARAALSRVLAGETVTEPVRMRRADGDFAATASSAPLRIDGAIVGMIATIRDMSAFAEATASLEASEERFRSLFDYSPDVVVALALDGHVTRANGAAAAFCGLSAAALVGRHALGFIAPQDEAAIRAAFARVTRGAAVSVEVFGRRGDGSTYPALATMIPIMFRGVISGVHLVARDLTAIRSAERALAAHGERLRELCLVAAVTSGAAEDQIVATIEAGCSLLGLSSGQLFDQSAASTIVAVGEAEPHPLLELALLSRGVVSTPDGVYIGVGVDVGGSRFGALGFSAAQPSGRAFSESDRDLVQLLGALVAASLERGRSRTRLHQLAYSDQLTTLPNRAWFSERLHEELRADRRAAGLAVMFLDLDRFKDINDTLGHGVGDRILRMVSDRLTAVVGSAGVVARMGGDEFTILVLEDADPEHVSALAERVIAAVEEPLVVDDFEQFVTTSIGIALHPADGADADTLIKHADVAMYRAKERGRNLHQFFTPALGASIATRISQDRALRKALENGEFELHYQPQFELAGGTVVGLEALVRWRHPRLGLIGPDQFIPAAELNGMIVGIGDWVLETACRSTRAWQRSHPGLRVAVNLSARQFHQNQLAEKISGVLARTGLQPDELELELTESVAMGDAETSVQILQQLGRAGVRLAVDDFGTGYSSLGYLKRFPLDCLKIDQSFVRDIMHEPDDATIVRTVIAMAHSLGLEVCAEGVETVDQLDFLRLQGCDRVQGFYLARPMPEHEVGRFLEERGFAALIG